MSVKFVRLTTLTLVCSLILTMTASCGKNDKNNFVLRTYSTFGAESDLAVYSEIISDFTKQHKNVIINDTTTDQSNSYKMELSISSTYKGSNSPDVIYFSAMSDMSELGDYFMTIDEIRKDYPNFASGVSEAILDSVAASDGNRYCIPIRGNWQGIVVNAALFRKSALNLPETWDDIINAANHFKNGNVSLFANSLDDSSALTEYLVRGLGGSESLQSAINGNPDSSWKEALEAIVQLDELSAFPPMNEGPFDYLVSASDLKNTIASSDKASSAINLYNNGNAAILLIDNSMCNQINADIDSSYIMLPSVGTVSEITSTTTASTSTTSANSEITLPSVRSTLPITPPNQSPSSGTGDSSSVSSNQRTASSSDTTKAENEDSDKAETGLYVNFAEGFYITKKAYYDEDKREDLLDFIEFFLDENNCVKFCNNYQVPSLSSISEDTADSLTEKSNIYNAVINSVQSAQSFITTTQTQDNSFFWNHCSMAVTYMSKGILSKDDALELIADTQSTVADIYQQKH